MSWPALVAFVGAPLDVLNIHYGHFHPAAWASGPLFNVPPWPAPAVDPAPLDWETVLFEPAWARSSALTATATGTARVMPTAPAHSVVSLSTGMNALDTAAVSAEGASYTVGVPAGPVYLMAHAFDPQAWRGLWQAATYYAAGEVVFSAGDSDAMVLICTVGGTSGAEVPAGPGADGTAEWSLVGSVSETAPVVNFLVT